MKIVLQNVINSKVGVNNKEVANINKGLLLLVSFTIGDDIEICQKMAHKIANLRCFLDENYKTNLSIKDVGGEILSISQFTIYADLRKGNRPSFVNALAGKEAKPLYEYFNKCLKDEGIVVKEGIFGEDMKVSLINDGPFTLVLDSKELF